MARLSERLRGGGFERAALVVRHVGQEKVDLAGLRESLRRDLYASTVDELRDRAAKVDELNLQLSKMQAAKALQAEIIKEVLAQYPAITRMTVADGSAGRRPDVAAAGAAQPDASPAPKPAASPEAAAGGAGSTAPVTLVLLQAQPALSSDDLDRIKAGLGVRLQGAQVEIVQLPGPAEAVAVKVRHRYR